MGIEYCVEAKRGLVHTTARGLLEVDEIAAYVEALLRDEDIEGPFVEIVDFTHADLRNLTYSRSESVVAMFKRLARERSYAGTVLIGSSDVKYGISRLYEAVFDDHGLRLRVVRHPADAEAAARRILAGGRSRP